MSVVQKTRRASLKRTLASVLTGTLIAAGALVGVAAPAQAASQPVSGATLDWGVKTSFVNYIKSPIASGTATAIAPATGTSPFSWTNGSGDLDRDTRTGSVAFAGGVSFVGHGGELDMQLTNPTVEFAGSTTGMLYVDAKSVAYGGGFPGVDVTRMPFATLTLPAPTVVDNVATWTGVTGTMSAEALAMFGGLYNDAPAMDPLTISVPLPAAPVAVETTTTLAATPNPAQEGDAVTLTATVAAQQVSSAPLAGTVAFFDGATQVGATQTIVEGAASVTVDSLAVGSHALTATFSPADAAAYAASTSPALTQVITAAPADDAEETTTALNITPAAPVLLGTEVSLSATVTVTDEDSETVPAGSVEFFQVLDGTTDRVALGTAALTDGTASIATTELTAGGRTFAAVFTPAGSDVLGSDVQSSANFGVVDTAEPAPYMPGADAVVSDVDATAEWDWSAYSAGWTKVATGDVTLDGETYQLTGGEVTADAGGAVIRFTGTLRTQAYEGFFPTDGQWIELVDPALHLTADGTGVWVAGVNTGVATYTPNPAAERIVVGVVSGYTGGGVGATGERVATFAYDGQTASGTWSAGRTGAWPNAYIMKAPSAIRSFYYASGAGGDADKPASALTVDFAWPAVSTTALSVAPETRAELGADVTLTAAVTPATAEGSVEFFATAAGVAGPAAPVSIGTADIVDGVATLVTNELAAGGYTFAAEFTSEEFDGSSAVTTANYGIVDTSTAPIVPPAAGSTFTGVTAKWDWSAYSSDWTKVAGGNVSVEDETFVLRNGTATEGADGAFSVSFTGTMRAEAYAAFFPTNGQWIELVDPTLTVDAAGQGTWTAGLRTGISVYNASAPAPRTVVATLSNVSLPDFAGFEPGDAFATSMVFDYADTTAPGTWSAAAGTGRTAAWSNAFVLAAPSAIQSFYYGSGAGGDVRKAPADLSIAWTAPVPAAAKISLSDTSVAQGGSLTVTGENFPTGARAVVTVNSDPITLGSTTVNASGALSVTGTIPADFATGAHTVTVTAGNVTVSEALTVTAAGTPVPAEPSCVARAVSGASFSWDVKASFRQYISGPIAGGSYSINWGAGSGAYNTDENRGRVNFGGAATFTGHNGALDIRMSNPRVQVYSATSAVLIVDVVSKGYNGSPDVSASGITFANLSLPAASVSGDRISWSGASASLTSAGASAFAGFYNAGDALDAVSFSFPLGAEVECDASTSGELATTGGEAPNAALLIGILMLIAGAGIVVIRRRTARA